MPACVGASFWSVLTTVVDTGFTHGRPELIGELRFYTGHMDNWYIEQAIYRLEAFFESTESPAYRPVFHYGVRAGHCWSPWEDEGDVGGLYREIAKSLSE